MGGLEPCGAADPREDIRDRRRAQGGAGRGRVGCFDGIGHGKEEVQNRPFRPIVKILASG